jgi:hypothetical protein
MRVSGRINRNDHVFFLAGPVQQFDEGADCQSPDLADGHVAVVSAGRVN